MKRILVIILIFAGLFGVVSLIALVSTVKTTDSEIIFDPEIVDLISLLLKIVSISTVVIILLAMIFGKKKVELEKKAEAMVTAADLQNLVELNQAIVHNDISMDAIATLLPYLPLLESFDRLRTQVSNHEFAASLAGAKCVAVLVAMNQVNLKNKKSHDIIIHPKTDTAVT